jgi:hypothetical protein
MVIPWDKGGHERGDMACVHPASPYLSIVAVPDPVTEA